MSQSFDCGCAIDVGVGVDFDVDISYSRMVSLFMCAYEVTQRAIFVRNYDQFYDEWGFWNTKTTTTTTIVSKKMVQKSQSYTIRAHNTLTDIQLCQWINEIWYVQSQCWLRRSHSKWKFLPLADASVYRTHNNWLRHRQACMLPFKETSWMNACKGSSSALSLF